MNFAQLGKMLIGFGALMIVLGGVMVLLGKIPGLGKLPGDILIKSEHGSFYFPIVSCIILSVLLSIILNLFNR